MADDRCRSKIAHESGAVLQCMEPRGHAGNHLTTREQWGDHHPDEIVESTGAHVYLSTGCLHGDHDYCQRVVGSWHKQPAQCKFCAAPCVCPCHSCPTCSGPIRETVGMVCQTCGTDYDTPTSVDSRPDAGWGRAVATLLDVAERTGSPAARWAADYLAADPDRRAPNATPASAGAPEAPPKDLQTRTENHDCDFSDTCRFDPRCPHYAMSCQQFEAHATPEEDR